MLVAVLLPISLEPVEAFSGRFAAPLVLTLDEFLVHEECFDHVFIERGLDQVTSPGISHGSQVVDQVEDFIVQVRCSLGVLLAGASPSRLRSDRHPIHH